MKLIYYRGKVPNFGDELNTLLWDKILPQNFLDDDERELFLGIGSIIFDDFPSTSRKHIVGSGFGGYTSLPDVHDGSWNVVFVRGPRTAEALGLPKSAAVCDSGMLINALDYHKHGERGDYVCFMPHYQSIDRGYWKRACELAGLKFLDPTENVEVILKTLARAKAVITEAMHGAIIADALRTPWIACKPIHHGHHAKWLDWAGSLDLKLRQPPLYPSSLLEIYVKLHHRRKTYGNRAIALNRSPVFKPFNDAATYVAAQRLRYLARLEPQLSADDNIERVVARAFEKIEKFTSGFRNS